MRQRRTFWVQQDLLEDAIHLFISRRDASARRLLRRFKELEDYSAVKQAARHLIPINDITYSRDFIVTPTFPNVDARDLARMITNYSPCIVCQGTDADYHRTIDCSHYRCPRCNRRQPGHTEALCSASEAEAPTFPPDLRSLNDLMRGGIFTQSVAHRWLMEANHIYSALSGLITSRPTEFLPPTLRGKRIGFEQANRWYVVRNGRIDGIFVSLTRATVLAMHVEAAMISVYESREEARRAGDSMHDEDHPFLDETYLIGARPPRSERRANTGVRPPTPHPRPYLGGILTSPGLTDVDLDSPVDDDGRRNLVIQTLEPSFGLLEENDENVPVRSIPTREAPPRPPHLIRPEPVRQPLADFTQDLEQVPLRQLATTPTSSFQPSPTIASPVSGTFELQHTDTGEVDAVIHRHRDGSTTIQNAPPPPPYS
ncbi:hypothetical protein EVJ58_g7484 [Rhodofomes roseus]|uniref:Uncharacterized protein n=1 Tax=Rhodofomes roseus TaxID=34475 RepID=A0A4Y9Y4G9_9APHY|nr:hypothetical protein EVJ58_g7484 [Rhodofomes roseus]